MREGAREYLTAGAQGLCHTLLFIPIPILLRQGEGWLGEAGGEVGRGKGEESCVSGGGRGGEGAGGAELVREGVGEHPSRVGASFRCTHSSPIPLLHWGTPLQALLLGTR